MVRMDVRRDEGTAVDSTAAAPEEAAERRHEHRVREWWHRDHPTFTALSGFFAGLAFMALVPALFAAILDVSFGERAAREAFPFVLLPLALPLVLLAFDGPRRFAKYMLVGMVVTALVVFGVAWLVTWLMVKQGA